MHNRRGNVTGLSNDSLVVESAIRQQEVHFLGVGVDGLEEALERGLGFVTTDVRHRQGHRFAVPDEVGRAVAVPVRRPVVRRH